MSRQRGHAAASRRTVRTRPENRPMRSAAARAARLALAAAACMTAALGALPTPAVASPPTGGAPVGGLAPTKPHKPTPAPPSRHARGRWIGRMTITEYWPAPESWFVGAPVAAPGLTGEHRIDWLYSAT